MITWNDFEKVEMRVGTILDVQDFPKAKKPAYQLTIDFGVELGIKKSSAQITKRYTKEDLIGKQIVAVVNFPKKTNCRFYERMFGFRFGRRGERYCFADFRYSC